MSLKREGCSEESVTIEPVGQWGWLLLKLAGGPRYDGAVKGKKREGKKEERRRGREKRREVT